ncbi:MAG TPA: hypothetical protein VJS15_01050 [Allosphingosinicella sp.]|nr:hypothetical protein [Allosphingosinicella sp.]
MNILRYLLFGIGIWAIPFVIGMAIFPVVDPSTALFDTIMSVAMSASAGWLSWLYLRGREGNGFASGFLGGTGWAAIAVLLDVPFFLIPGAMAALPVPDYVADVGLTYAMIPIIAGFIGLSLRR